MKQSFLYAIQKLYTNYDKDVKKTVQNHHWIEQCILKRTEDYPFLQQPPMDIDLFTSDTNLTLIVGHNGPHSPRYAEYIEGKLVDLKLAFRNEFGTNYRVSMGDNPAVKQFINNEIENIIKDIKKEIKENKDLINSSGEIFILE